MVRFWISERTLSIDVVFSTMSLIHVLRLSVGANLTLFLESAPEALVSVERIRSFLLRKEVDEVCKPVSSLPVEKVQIPFISSLHEI